MPVTVLAQKPLDHTAVFEIENEDPSVLGLAAFIGSVAVDRILGIAWLKTGSADTAWQQIALVP